MKRLFAYLRPYTGRMTLGLFIKFVGTMMDLLIPWALTHILNEVVPQKDVGLLLWWSAAMLAFSAVAFSFNVIANRMATVVARDSALTIRRDAFSQMVRLTVPETDRLSQSSLISRLTTDTYNVHAFIGRIQRLGVRAPILLIGGAVITLSMEPVLAGVLLATMPLVTIASVMINKKGLPMFLRQQKAIDRLVLTVRDNIAGARVIKALGMEENEIRRFGEVNDDVSRWETRSGVTMALSSPIMNIILNMGLCAVILVGAGRTNLGLTQPGTVIAFLTYFSIILNAMLNITRIFVMYTKASASMNRLDELLSAKTELPKCYSEDGGDKAAAIEFSRVRFSYSGGDDEKLNLRGISFKLRKGETLGVLGATGSGKSTLIRLLERFYIASGGEIYIFGKPIGDFSEKELHSLFGSAFQSDILFADTIRSNVDFGRGLTDAEIIKALKCAQAYDFVFEGEEGLSKRLAPRGADLSGGQKQRLYIARALAASPAILVLDDSSSALDYQTDASLRRDIREMYPETTVVCIAQRVSSVHSANLILCLDEGRSVGLGTHDELMRSCEIYRETAQLQMGGEE